MKRKIGFDNFRRFIHFEPIEYDHITFLVGRNNSGKSTVVKALMLVVNYLKQGAIDTFSFADDVLESANIVTYERAKNRLATEDRIQFIHGFGPYEVQVTITGEDGMTTARVQELVIADNSKGMRFTLAPQVNSIRLDSFTVKDDRLEAEVKSMSDEVLNESEVKLTEIIKAIHNEFKARGKREIEALKKELRNWTGDKTSKEYIRLNQDLEWLRKKQAHLVKGRPFEHSLRDGFTIESEYQRDQDLRSAIQFVIAESMSMTFDRFKKLPENKGRKANELKERYSHFTELQGGGKEVRGSIDGFFAHLNEVSLYYLGANSTKQPALFAIRDRNNALAQAIHEYQQLGIRPGEAAHRFLLQWLDEKDGFEVGDAFEIVTRAGEAYEVNVSSHGTKIPLSDKGMGSIQAMLLLFRLACIIHKTEKNPPISPLSSLRNRN